MLRPCTVGIALRKDAPPADVFELKIADFRTSTTFSRIFALSRRRRADEFRRGRGESGERKADGAADDALVDARWWEDALREGGGG